MKAIYTLFSLFLAALFLFSGNVLFLNSSNLLMGHATVPQTLIGLINTVYFLGAIMSSVAAHRIVSRVGHARSFSFFASIMAICILLYGLSFQLYVWAILRFIQGFAYYAVLMIIESWLNEKSDPSSRSRLLGIYEIVFYMAFSIGALLLNLSNSFVHITQFSVILLILAILPLSLTKIPAPIIPEPKKISIPSLFALAPLALMGSLIGGFIANGFMSMIPVYTSNLHFNVRETSIFMTCAMAGGLLIQLPMGRFSDTYGRRIAISIAASITCAAALLSLFLVHVTYAQYLLAAGFGLGAFSIYPLSLARAHDVLPADSPSRIEISRSVLFAYSLGALAAPLTLGISTQILGAVGFETPFILLSAFLAFFAIRQPVIPQEERTSYVHVTPSATNTLLAESDSIKETEKL
ncbi:MAG: MFS transporter [Neisseriaceae bacterium]